MAYIPKSKYKISETSGGEFYTIIDQKQIEYVGPYILTGGKAYIGNDIADITTILSPIINQTRVNNIIYTSNSYSYNKSNNYSSHNFLEFQQFPVSTKRKPTKRDYTIGYYERYFVKKNNSILDYFEIKKKTHEDLLNKKSKYDYNLYTAGSLRWALSGDVIKANSIMLKIKEKEFPNLSSLFYILDEFQEKSKVINQTQTKETTGYIAPENIQSQITPTGGGGY